MDAYLFNSLFHAFCHLIFKPSFLKKKSLKNALRVSKDIGRQIRNKSGHAFRKLQLYFFMYPQTDGIIDCGYLFELQPLGDSNEDPQFIFGQITKLSTYLNSLNEVVQINILN